MLAATLQRNDPELHAFDVPQVVHWLRLGCVPVGVIEGRPPPEKLEALRARFKSHTGFTGGGGGGGAAAFQRLGSRVGAMLTSMVRACGHRRWHTELPLMQPPSADQSTGLTSLRLTTTQLVSWMRAHWSVSEQH